MNNQCQRILSYLENHGAITQKEAAENLGIWRLSARIADLRRQGYDIRSQMITVKNRFGEDSRIKKYWSVKE